MKALAHSGLGVTKISKKYCKFCNGIFIASHCILEEGHTREREREREIDASDALIQNLP
jgi:hypothetical protein